MKKETTKATARPQVPRENLVWLAFSKIVGEIAAKDDGEVLTQDEVLAYAAATTTGAHPARPDFWKAYRGHLEAQRGRKPTAAKTLWKQARLRIPNVVALWDASRLDADAQDGVEKLIEFLHLDREALWAKAEEEVAKKEGK